MRFKLYFEGRESCYDNGKTRERFISFLKKTFEHSDLNYYKVLFDRKSWKPYVFSPFFGKDFAKYGKVGPRISLIFSSGDSEALMNFWNGIFRLKQIREDYIRIQDISFFLVQTKFFHPEKIKERKVLFETVGVCVMTDPTQPANNFDLWYVTPNDLERFNRAFYERTKQRYENIKGAKFPESELYLEPCEIKEVVVDGVGGKVKGFKGKFYIVGEPEILQFLYDFGLGVRTGQGFGLIDVVRRK
jgi:CRISPR-associated endoribonuclease Cas6